MKVIGLLGGMSWESSAEYYRIINQEIKIRLSGLTSAKLILYSVDFGEIGKLQHAGKWDELSSLLTNAAVDLESIGAEGILICTNTMHIVAEDMKKALNVPIIHIVEETGKKIKEKGIKKVGLLGTIYTMDSPLYRDFLQSEYNIEVITPSKDKKKIVNDIIYNELILGKIETSSKNNYIEIINSLAIDGAEGIILGCTEIPLLIKQEDVQIPVFDTTQIHALSAVEFMIK
ncbi:MAG: putative amino-acid racemase [Candidatus Heimdallarchaeota archaeon LC_3]|nr:MAG: putative amino-acid racemase [Candidatus Heimdallarchaeota archaeon LC_3]